MTKDDFHEAFGYWPHEAVQKTAPINRNRAKSISKPIKGVRNSKKNLSASDLEYERLTEEEHQIIVIKWLDDMQIYFEASINGLYLPNPHPKGSRAWQTQMRANRSILAKLKKQGFRKGIADLKIFLPHIELNIELKKVGGSPTHEQKENVERFKSYQYAEYKVITGWKEVIKYIKSFMD